MWKQKAPPRRWGSPARERVEQREGRDVLVIHIVCFVPKGAHAAVGHPTVVGDDQSHVAWWVCPHDPATEN
jgi:hypothetical protein